MVDIEFASQPRKFLKKCDKTTQQRIVNKIEDLRNNPFPRDSRKVEGREEKTYRVRVGDYRILYSLYIEKNLLFISIIDKRSKAYD